MGPDKDEEDLEGLLAFVGILETGEGEPSATELLRESREQDEERYERLRERFVDEE